MNIDKIITESINEIVREAQMNVGSNGWHSWEETDAANGMSSEEGKATRMKPGNAVRPKGTVPTKDYGIVRGYSDWNSNFRQVMDYPSYCKRFGLRR